MVEYFLSRLDELSRQGYELLRKNNKLLVTKELLTVKELEEVVRKLEPFFGFRYLEKGNTMVFVRRL